MSGTHTHATAAKFDFSIATKDCTAQLTVLKTFSHIISFDPGNNPTIQVGNIATSISQVKRLGIGEMWIATQSFTAIRGLKEILTPFLVFFSAFILITIKKRCCWVTPEPTEQSKRPIKSTVLLSLDSNWIKSSLKTVQTPREMSSQGHRLNRLT